MSKQPGVTAMEDVEQFFPSPNEAAIAGVEVEFGGIATEIPFLKKVGVPEFAAAVNVANFGLIGLVSHCCFICAKHRKAERTRSAYKFLLTNKSPGEQPAIRLPVSSLAARGSRTHENHSRQPITELQRRAGVFHNRITGHRLFLKALLQAMELNAIVKKPERDLLSQRVAELL